MVPFFPIVLDRCGMNEEGDLLFFFLKKTKLITAAIQNAQIDEDKLIKKVRSPYLEALKKAGFNI